MGTKNAKFKLQSLSIAFLLALTLGFWGFNGSTVSAHGGEDHGDEKPKVAAAGTGTVSRTARISHFEIMLKHPVLEPDRATAARLFITEFETNEAVKDAIPTVEIESPNGAVTQVEVEKTEITGTFGLKIPALSEGIYIIRTTSGGDTATFCGIEIAHPATETEVVGTSWFGTALLFMVGAIVLGSFGLLFYLVRRLAGEKQIHEEVVSA